MDLKKLVTFGNGKLPKSTIIFNMSSATDCTSKRMGQCLCSSKCYAMKAERLYPQVLPYRNRQNEYWINTNAEQICKDFVALLSKKRSIPTLFRFNEAGDFISQDCIVKLSIIASFLYDNYKIVTYGYTARKDLDFSKCSFLVKGSGHDNGNNGQTMVLYKGQEKPTDFVKCPGDCKKCSLCSSTKGINVAFPVH